MGNLEDHEHGISEYRAYLGCIRRYGCEKEWEDEGGESPDADFGTHLHSWLAKYHFDAGEGCTLSTDIPEGRYVSEAELAHRYASRFSSRGLGTPIPLKGKILVEERLRMDVTMPDGTVEPFAGTLDTATIMDADDCDLFEKERGVKIFPGRYLHDFKTKAKKDNQIIARFLGDAQFTGYQRLYEAHGGEPLDGTLVHILFRYKDDKPESFLSLLVPPPSEQDIKVWMSIIKEGARRRRELGPAFVDPTHCWDYARLCPCFPTCPRHNFGS